MLVKARFDKFESGKSVNYLSNFFGVSVPTVRKWQRMDATVPSYVGVIISLDMKLNAKQKELELKEFELLGFKQTLNDYINSKNKLESLLDDK